MAQTNTLLEVTCTVVVAPTHKKAFLAKFHDSDGVELGEAWLPYSRVKQILRGEGGFTVSGEVKGAEITVEIPQWLAESDSLEPLIREQLLEKEDLGDGVDEDPDDDIPF